MVIHRDRRDKRYFEKKSCQSSLKMQMEIKNFVNIAGFKMVALTPIFHADLLQKPGIMMNTSLDSHVDLGAVGRIRNFVFGDFFVFV